jgi:hypothetical protein
MRVLVLTNRRNCLMNTIYILYSAVKGYLEGLGTRDKGQGRSRKKEVLREDLQSYNFTILESIGYGETSRVLETPEVFLKGSAQFRICLLIAIILIGPLSPEGLKGKSLFRKSVMGEDVDRF